MKCKYKGEVTKEELTTFSFNELCAYHANLEKWFIEEGKSKGPNGKLYMGNRRRLNAEFKRRRELCQSTAKRKEINMKTMSQLSLEI